MTHLFRDKLLDSWREGVETGLSVLAQESSRESMRLQEAAAYVLVGGGKRLRALLTLAVSHDLVGQAGRETHAIIPAVAIEVIHAASLVHDDLPALDNDDMRRGKPACHKAFGEATAILVGDLLIGAALASLSHPQIPLDRQARLSGVISRTWRELCVGQQLDLEKPEGDTRRHRMVELKTGALFGAALACGAICAGSVDSVTEALSQWGVRLGCLFQKLDDVDDGERDRSALGAVQEECRQAVQDLGSAIGRDLPMTCEVARLALKL